MDCVCVRGARAHTFIYEVIVYLGEGFLKEVSDIT